MHWLLALGVGIAIAQLATLATTVYLHRGLAHRAVTIHPAAGVVLRFFLWMSTGMRAREWAAVHRKHHAASDTVDDPHSPIVLGFWRVQLANAAFVSSIRLAAMLPPWPSSPSVPSSPKPA